MRENEREETPDKELFSGEKVLLVDDNKISVDVTRTVLEQAGVRVDTANTGEEAIELFLKSKEGEYSLIFMDINMYGMNGYETTQKIRRMNRKDAQTVLIFAVSADIQSTYKEKALEAGMNGCICKPFSYHDILKQMHRLLEEKEGEEVK